MRNHPYFGVVVDVAKATLQTEHGLDGAVVETARLIDTTITASQSAKLPAHEVQPALEYLGEAMAGLITSRKQIGRAHAEFGKTAEKLGATPQSFGDWWPCPQIVTEPTGTAEPLRVVGG